MRYSLFHCPLAHSIYPSETIAGNWPQLISNSRSLFVQEKIYEKGENSTKMDTNNTLCGCKLNREPKMRWSFFRYLLHIHNSPQTGAMHNFDANSFRHHYLYGRRKKHQKKGSTSALVRPPSKPRHVRPSIHFSMFFVRVHNFYSF